MYKYVVIPFDARLAVMSLICSNSDDKEVNKFLELTVDYREYISSRSNVIDAFVELAQIGSKQQLVESTSCYGSFPFVYDQSLFVPCGDSDQALVVIPEGKWIECGRRFDKLVTKAMQTDPVCNILQ